MTPPCIHRGKLVLKIEPKPNEPPAPVHLCGLHGRCSPDGRVDKHKSCLSGCAIASRADWIVDVVITSHNYGQFIGEALESVFAQDRNNLGSVIVVDDSSGPDDKTKEIADAHRAIYVRTECRNPHQARGEGFKRCNNRLVCFLDADNTMQPDYLKSAAEAFAQNPRLAIAYPNLQQFGAHTNLVEHPPEFSHSSFESINVVDSGSVWRAEAIEQTDPFAQSIPRSEFEDWTTAKTILRSAPWEAQRSEIALNYRRHPVQRLTNDLANRTFYQLAGLERETVTVFLTISGRSEDGEFFKRQVDWLNNQSWPKSQVRILIANTSHAPMPMDWLSGFVGFAGVSWYDHPVGYPKYEDVNRANTAVENHVQTVVASILNRAIREANTEYFLSLENDVFPESPDSIRSLLSCFAGNVCAVSGAYQQRYWPYGWTAWKHASQKPGLLTAKGTGVEDVAGTGFGCLMLRRSQFVDEPISGNTPRARFYDVDLFSRQRERGRIVRLNWNVTCEHGGEKIPLAQIQQQPPAREPVGTKLSEILKSCGIDKKPCAPCQDWMAAMDRWGIQGCQQNRQIILQRLNDASREATWFQWAQVAARGYLSVDALLDEAIRRTKA